jgi:hypothetical protein
MSSSCGYLVLVKPYAFPKVFRAQLLYPTPWERTFNTMALSDEARDWIKGRMFLMGDKVLLETTGPKKEFGREIWFQDDLDAVQFTLLFL